jgi:two-component system, chemotaxis family, chemotaxis protein CheY
MASIMYIIDDCEISLFLAASLLEFESLTENIIPFLSASDALNKIKEGQEPLPLVILLDLNMPVMSGWDFLEALTKLEPKLTDKCSIFILSSSLDQEEKKRALSYPLVEGFLQKPLSDEAINTLKAYVKG